MTHYSEKRRAVLAHCLEDEVFKVATKILRTEGIGGLTDSMLYRGVIQPADELVPGLMEVFTLGLRPNPQPSSP